MLSYYEKLKKIFFNNIDVKRATDKQLWKTVKPRLTDEALKDERLTVTEKEKFVSNKRELIKFFNE